MEAADRERVARDEALDRERDLRTPKYFPYVRWAGAAVAVAGALIVPVTYFQYDAGTTTRSQFDSLRTWNTVGWVAAPVGLAAFVASYVFRPAARPGAPPRPASSSSALSVGPQGINWTGSF